MTTKKTKAEKMQNEMGFLDKKIKSDPELRKLYQQEGLIFDITELIAQLMEEKKVGYNRLSEYLGEDFDYVKSVLDGSKELTLRQVADIFTALGSELVVTCKGLK